MATNMGVVPLRRLRTTASLLAFVAGCLLMGGAGATLLAAYLLPYEGLQDLGRVVLAMLLASLAILPFGLALALGRRGSPRWMRAASLVGLILAAVPAVALLSACF